MIETLIYNYTGIYIQNYTGIQQYKHIYIVMDRAEYIHIRRRWMFLFTSNTTSIETLRNFCFSVFTNCKIQMTNSTTGNT